MRRVAMSATLAVAVAAGVVAGVPAPAASGTTYTHGYDVSWPQCDGHAAGGLPSGGATYAILGLTHGAGHTANPCLGAQLDWARAHHVAVGGYLVPSYPTNRQLAAARTGPYGACGHDLTCRLHNDGARQATDALKVLRRTHLPAPMVWVDVEFRSHPEWSRSTSRNRAVLAGVVRGLREARMPFGVYTTSYMWHAIAGDWTLRVPNWLPSGDGRPADAKKMCATSGTGGRTWLAQYTRTWDEDLTCPVLDPVPPKPGPLWRYRHAVLRLGSSGAAVTAAQRAIGIGVTGQYDAATVLGVYQWQQARGLPSDGRVDTDDWRALGAFRRHGGRPFGLWKIVARVR